ncbi:hypothetical protein [Bradyrhizobium sp.]|uniref:hypothetical protein n=1 Tax=Bradyrhizobium sp. TaxID=376 RepID=UPI004037D71B
MPASSGRKYPVISRLIERVKRLADRSDELPEFRRMDDLQVGQIAHEFGLSRAELYTLCASRASDGLLKQRLAEFGLTEELLAKMHPEVLQDLQRVCGTCTTTARCADDFARHRDSGRDEYCPNICTLYALKQEGVGQKERKNDSCCCGSCGS